MRMREQFEEQLEQLHREVTEMGNLCEQAIALATKALFGGNDQLAKEVFRRDASIDRKEREIEDLCMRLFLHQQPMARDLRTVSAALKMVSDMERIGDQAADVAELSRYIGDQTLQSKVSLGEMAEATKAMVIASVVAFVKGDEELVKKVIQADDKVDGLFEQVKEEIMNLIYQRDIDAKASLDLLMAAKYFERIGDHAVNIAEWVEYSITGVHTNNEHVNI